MTAAVSVHRRGEGLSRRRPQCSVHIANVARMFEQTNQEFVPLSRVPLG